MPEFILSKHAVRHLRLVAASQSICSSQCTACHREARAQLQVTRLEHTFEQQDGATPAQGARTRSASGHPAGQSHRPRAGLQTPAQCRARRRWSLTTAQTLASGTARLHALEVVLQGSGVDVGLDRGVAWGLTG